MLCYYLACSFCKIDLKLEVISFTELVFCVQCSVQRSSVQRSSTRSRRVGVSENWIAYLASASLFLESWNSYSFSARPFKFCTNSGSYSSSCFVSSSNSFGLYTVRGGGGGWRVEPERRLEGQHSTKLGRKKHRHDWLYTSLQSINFDDHRTCRKVPFFTRHFALPSMSLIFIRKKRRNGEVNDTSPFCSQHGQKYLPDSLLTSNLFIF